MGIWDQFDDEEEDEAFRDAMEMADSVKDGWGAREQLEACLAVAEAALLSKAAKAQRREQAEEERRREARERAMAAQREREESEAREIVAAREREALRVRREWGAQQSAIPATPAGPSAEELRRQERERQVAAEERAAKVRLANAQAAEIEAKAELMRAQARAAATAPGSLRHPMPGRIAAPPRAPLPRVAVRPPPPAPVRARVVESPLVAGLTPPVAAVASPPAESRIPTWTGADLARFRAVRHLSQRELAALMGVGHGMVAKAEVVPAKALGDGMAAAFSKVALRGSATG